MKHKTWFRLVLKAIGVFLLATGVPDMIARVGQLVYLADLSMPGTVEWGVVIWMTAESLQVALALYLLFGGKWIVNVCIPSNRPYCPDCGYDVSKGRGDVCPECGVVQPRTHHGVPRVEIKDERRIVVPRKVGVGAGVRFEQPIAVTPLATEHHAKPAVRPMSSDEFRLNAMRIRA